MSTVLNNPDPPTILREALVEAWPEEFSATHFHGPSSVTLRGEMSTQKKLPSCSIL